MGEFRGLGSIQEEWPLHGSWIFHYPVNDIHIRVEWETSLWLLPSQTRWHMNVAVLQMIDFRFLDKGSTFCF